MVAEVGRGGSAESGLDTICAVATTARGTNVPGVARRGEEPRADNTPSTRPVARLGSRGAPAIVSADGGLGSITAAGFAAVVGCAPPVTGAVADCPPTTRGVQLGGLAIGTGTRTVTVDMTGCGDDKGTVWTAGKSDCLPAVTANPLSVPRP